MKAAVNRVYGPPSVIRVTNMPTPSIKTNEIRIHVRATTVNRTDDGFLRAKPFIVRFFSGLRKPKNIVLGCEFAGTVESIGSDVTQFKIGDKVFGFDDIRFGGHGEYKVIAENSSVARMPEKASFKEMAAAGEGAHYALSYVRSMQKTGAHKVLVHGGTGAIGSAAIQLLKFEGMHVIATAPTKHVALVKSLGANKVIDWQRNDFSKCNETFDVVFDAVGKSSFRNCKPLLRKRGVYISTELGPGGQNPLLALIAPLFKLVHAKRVMFPLPKNTQEMIEYLSARVADKDFKPLIDKTYSLENINDAYTYVETGQKIGNVTIKL